MRRLIVLGLLPLLATTSAHAADLKATSKIDGVTVYPQGAEVTRIGKVHMERGDQVIFFNDLPTNAVPGSIRVEGKATAKLEIGSVDTRRVKVPSTDEAVAATERKRIEDDIQKLRDDRAVLGATVEAAETQKLLISNLAQLPTRPTPSNAGAAPAQPDWAQLYGIIGQRIAEAQKTILETQVKIRETELQIRDLENKLSQLAPTQLERSEVKVFVNAGGPLDADIVIHYQVTSASWTPFYDARLSTGTKAAPPKLQLVRRAGIQQRSGEIWDNVALSLSTARPGAGTIAPELVTMTVDYEGEGYGGLPRPIAPMTRSVGVAGRIASSEDSERLSKEQVVAADELRATVDAQAFQAVYGIAGRVTVPATGETKRVQIDDMQLDPVLTLRTVPKRDQKAFLYAKVAMARGTPILPGPVSLFRDATFVGNGKLPLLAPGQDYEMGFGVDDALTVRHAIAEEKRSESGIISTSKTDTRNYRIVVKNLHERAINVVVLDQIPVSQNNDIKVELIGKTQPTKRDLDDKRGVVSWEMKLEPDEEKTIEFGYNVTWPSAKKVIYGN